MPLEFFDCEQNTPEWMACRRGIPTASQFATVLAKGKGGGESTTRKTYLYKLAGEIITGQLSEGYSNPHMERGHQMEPEARSAYAFMRDCDPQTVGFIRNGRAGASPDSLIGETGLLEIKTKLPHLMIEAMFRDDMPPEHRAQVQGQIWISEREWCDLACYWPGMPLVVFRVVRDDEYLRTLASAVDAFNEELDRTVERVRAYSDPDTLRRSLAASVAA